jgi:hypothetical protein
MSAYAKLYLINDILDVKENHVDEIEQRLILMVKEEYARLLQNSDPLLALTRF